MDGTEGSARGALDEADEATRAHFTARAAGYCGSGEASLQAILDLAAPRPGERVLDVATGTGLVLFALAEQVVPGGLAAGVDFTPAMLAEAVRRRQAGTPQTTPAHPAGLTWYPEPAPPAGAGSPPPPLPGGSLAPDPPAAAPPGAPALIAADATRLPFRPETFDAVTCRFAVHHFSDPAASLAAMAAVLRPGGRLVIADFVRPVDPEAAAEQERLERLRGHEYVALHTRPALEALLAGAGCPVVAARDAEREQLLQEWLEGPNVKPEARAPLGALFDRLAARGGAGLAVRHAAGEVRLVRTDAVLLGRKASAPPGLAL